MRAPVILVLLAACKVTQVNTVVERESVTFFPTVCERVGFANASDEQAGYWLAARITPPEWPFEVADMGYSVTRTQVTATGEECGVVDHEVAIYAATTIQDAPDYHERFEVIDYETTNIDAPHLSHQLDTPLRVEEGEDVFVMVKASVARNGRRMCYITCRDRGVNDRNFWSNATDEPFSWVELRNTGLDVDLGVSIGGRRLVE